MIDLDRMTREEIDWASQHIPGVSLMLSLRPSHRTKGPSEPERAKPAKQRGEPNALELDFKSHCTVDLEYEAITFHLMPGCSYTPDWVLPRGFTPTFIEVKSDSTNPTIKSRYAASIVKLKICAKTYECMPFYLARKDAEGKWKLYPVTSQGISRKPREVLWLN